MTCVQAYLSRYKSNGVTFVMEETILEKILEEKEEIQIDTEEEI